MSGVEKDVVNTRVIIVSSVLTCILILASVYVLEGWFERYAEKVEIESSVYDGSESRQIESEQLELINPEAPKWADKDKGIATLPLQSAMELAVKQQKELQEK